MWEEDFYKKAMRRLDDTAELLAQTAKVVHEMAKVLSRIEKKLEEKRWPYDVDAH